MRRIGPYEVVRELGRGGMGVVFEVRDPAVAERRLALKLILPGAASDEALARFAREAQLLARVKHPNVVAIHACARAPEGPYLVTDFVEGEPLSRRVDWTPTAAATLVRALCDAVAALHAQGIVHRDLKPDNVIVRADGSPVLLDFGVARGAGTESLTQSGVVVGTPHYMAPEQAEGKNVVALDARADVYGLGAVLFYLVAGRRPFDEREGGIALVRAVLDLEPRWPSEDDRDVPRELEAVVREAMQKDPARRYDTARAMGQDLARWLAGEPTQAAAHPTRPRRVVGVVAAALVVVTIAALARGRSPGPAVEPAVEPTTVATAAVVTPAPELPPRATPPLARRPLADASVLPVGRGALAWSGDALFAAGGGSFALWSLPAAPVVTRLKASGEPIMTTDPTGTRVAIGWTGGGYCLVPPDGVNLEVQPSPDGLAISALALSPGGGTLALGSGPSKKVFLVPLDGADALRSLAFPQVLTDMAWSCNGRWLACAAWDPAAGMSVVRVFRREDRAWKEPRELQLPFVLNCVDVGPDDTVVAGDDAGRVVVLPPGDAPHEWLGVPDEVTGLAGLRAHSREVHDLVVAEDGRRLYSLGPDARTQGDSELRVWDLPGRRQVALVPLDGLSNRMALTRDGRRLALSGPDGHVEVWDVEVLLAPLGG